MASVYLSDAQGLKPFDCSETAVISARWERWPRVFELFATEKGAHHVRQVETEGTQGDDCEYAFGILDHSNFSSDEKISVKIEGLPVTMIIDSGASCNVIGRNVWEYLKANKVACVSTTASKKLYAYGSNQPLQVAGMFTAEVSVRESVLSGVEFLVIFIVKMSDTPSLGRKLPFL